ncbi:MAG: class 1 fructose-bisphosphatase [Brachymonas sp.]|nr:class 1 fructose-bisphosphatase [Brachymonas sp.]
MPQTAMKLLPQPLPHRYTLTQYLIDQRKRYPEATGDFNALMLDVGLACKAISRAVAFGKLGAIPGHPVVDMETDACCAQHAAPPQGASPGAQKKALDDVSNACFIRMNSWGGHLAGMISEEMPQPCQIPTGQPRGKYLLAFDPVDGSVNIDVNVTVGSIFSILRAPDEVVNSGRDVVVEDFLQPGCKQVAAGYALYGPMTMLVMSVGHGVFGFTLDPNLGQFMLTHPDMRIPEETREFAINASNARFWEPPVKRYVDECLAGESGERGKDFNMRWVASMAAETHRILMRGGVFMYPVDTRDPARPAKLRLLYEANPIAFLVEQAGGRASTGYEPVLQVQPKDVHQRVGLICGSRSEIERIERYHQEKTHDAPLRSPLFAERGLFRQC